MKVGIKGKGAEIKWVDIQDLPTTKELVKFKKETQELIKELQENLRDTKLELRKALLSNVQIVKGLIER